jgi:DNA-binding response OmpR family regulator
MPIMDGWSFVQQYRRAAAVPAAIVVMSAAGDLATVAQQLDADGHLKKPFDLQGLYGLVASQLDGHPPTRPHDDPSRPGRRSSAPLN